MEPSGVRRVATTVVLSLIAAAVAVLNFGGGAIAQECGGGSPSPSPSTSSPSPTESDGPLPTLPPLPGEDESETPTPTPSTSSPGGGGSNETIKCDSDISIRFAARTDTFRGSVTSDEDACERGRRVILKRVRRGPDQTVGRTTTNGRGNWSIRERNADGRYYAQAPKRTVAAPGPDFVCGAARSRTVRA